MLSLLLLVLGIGNKASYSGISFISSFIPTPKGYNLIDQMDTKFNRLNIFKA